MIENVRNFLSDAVFYPCSGLDGKPVKFVGGRFRSYFYVDYAIDRSAFEAACSGGPGFRGYQLEEFCDLDFEEWFGPDWSQSPSFDASELAFEFRDEFVAAARFGRLPNWPEEHGPRSFQIVFARCEAVLSYRSVFSRLQVAPRCLAHIRSGMAFGGNYSGYVEDLCRAISENPAGLPRFILSDEMGSDRRSGDYFSPIESYAPIETWDIRASRLGDGSLTLFQHRAFEGSQADIPGEKG